MLKVCTPNPIYITTETHTHTHTNISYSNRGNKKLKVRDLAVQPANISKHRTLTNVTKQLTEEDKKQVWDEKFKFKVDYEGEGDQRNTKLTLRVMDKHQFSSDKLVGETT